LKKWSLHDLRRTAGTLMSQAKVPYDVAERCMGNIRGEMDATYNMHEYIDEKRAAFEALAQLLKRIIDPRGNVVEFSKKARKRKRKSV
jgi:integrase